MFWIKFYVFDDTKRWVEIKVLVRSLYCSYSTIMSEILAAWMLFRASDVVSKLHSLPITSHSTWTYWRDGPIGRFSVARVSQLHEAWGSLPNLQLLYMLSKLATQVVMLELVILVHDVSRLHDARPAQVRHSKRDQWCRAISLTPVCAPQLVVGPLCMQ